MKKMLIVLSAVVMFLVVGCAPAVKNALTIADIEPKLAYIGGASIGFADNSEDGLVTYIQIGDADFDKFFKSAAKLDGLVRICQGMTTTATGQLKKFAMSKAADAAMKDNINDLVDNTPPEQWSTEQSIAVMKMAKGQGKINSDEVKYFATTAGSIGITVFAMGKGIVEAKDLVLQAKDLLQNVKAVSPLKIPAATKGLKESLGNLNSVVKNTPKTLEEMKVLLDGFKALS